MKRAADEQVRFFFSLKTRAHTPVVGIICTDNRHSCRKQKMGKWSRKKARIPSNGQVNTSCAPARTQNHCEATKIYQLGRFSHWGRAGRKSRRPNLSYSFTTNQKQQCQIFSSLASRCVILCLNCDLYDITKFDHYFHNKPVSHRKETGLLFKEPGQLRLCWRTRWVWSRLWQWAGSDCWPTLVILLLYNYYYYYITTITTT